MRKQLIRPFALGLMVLLALAACDQGSQGGLTQQGEVEGIRLEKVSVIDSAAGGEAFTFLRPVGWQSDGGVRWQHEYANVASAGFRVWDPSGVTAAEAFPTIPFGWQDGGVPLFPVGSVYLGNQVNPPIPEPADFVAQMVLPTFRSGVAWNIIDYEETPDVSGEVVALIQEPGLTKTVRSGRVRVQYDENGTTIHEDFFVTLTFTQSNITPFVLWGPERIYSFKAAAGQLEDAASLLHAIVFSAQPNPAWLNQYLQVVDLWHQGQLAAIQSAGELSRYIAGVNDEILESTLAAYEERQRVDDRLSREWSEVIRGVETYDDPNQDFAVELPSGYDRVWSSANGEYILSINPLFDPNVGSSIDWDELTPTP